MLEASERACCLRLRALHLLALTLPLALKGRRRCRLMVLPTKGGICDADDADELMKMRVFARASVQLTCGFADLGGDVAEDALRCYLTLTAALLQLTTDAAADLRAGERSCCCACSSCVLLLANAAAGLWADELSCCCAGSSCVLMLTCAAAGVRCCCWRCMRWRCRRRRWRCCALYAACDAG